MSPSISAQPPVMALRFRDLGVPDTIDAHNAIASEAGSVWWGWWKKPDEHTPRPVLADLEQAIADQGRPVAIYLVDSGHERLYEASLSAIHVPPGVQDDARALTPDAALTPDYYSNVPFPVWFKFEGLLKERPADDIRLFTYQEVPEADFVADRHLARYDGKRVESIQEMLSRRHRTIWFLRPFASGDREGELVFEAAEDPKPFQVVPIAAKSDSIVLISDLHFSEAGLHQFALKATPGAPDLFRVLTEDVAQELGGRPPAAVVVSGDLTWQGLTDEFEHARDLLSRLRSAWDLDWSQFIVVPGNHDITWLPSGDDPDHLPAKVEAEGAFRDFLARTVRFKPPEQLSVGRRYLLSNFLPVDVVAVNSSRFEHESFRGYGFVGGDQLSEAFEAMGWTRGGETGPKVRVLVLHHHVVPVTPQEKPGGSQYSLTLDAGELLYTALEYGVDLILHGHQHRPFIAGYSRFVASPSFPSERMLMIHGAGSVSVASSHLPESVANAYSLLRFDHNQVTVSVRELSSLHGAAFRGSWTASFERTPSGFRGVPPRAQND